MAERFKGQVALVTGGSSGIGRAAAVAFAAEGASVVVAARREVESEETVRLIRDAGGEASAVRTDVAVASGSGAGDVAAHHVVAVAFPWVGDRGRRRQRPIVGDRRRKH